MKALVTRATMTGTETILGEVTATLTSEAGLVTHVSVLGSVIHEAVHGLPLPVEERLGETVELTLVPLAIRYPHLMTVELIS